MSNPKPFVLLLSGPAGAGKSTIAREWSSRQSGPTASISLDDIRRFVITGRADPHAAWSDTAQQQLDIAREICAEAALKYVKAGYNCVIDDAIFPNRPGAELSDWTKLLGHTDTRIVVILPSLEVVLKRNRIEGAREVLTDEMIKAIYIQMEPWIHEPYPVIDNSEISLSVSVEKLNKILAEYLDKYTF